MKVELSSNEVTHDWLCKRANTWLRGTRRCEPVFSNCASCDEIPDAIGWSSVWNWRGSTVIECKTSVSDFYADKKKRVVYEDKFGRIGSYVPLRTTRKMEGFKEVEIPLMGDFRFYMCVDGLLNDELIQDHQPDHGLLWVSGRKVRIVRPAPRRENVNLPAEIRYLRFAIINRKKSHEIEPEPQLSLETHP
jgi:hypothetical protein